MPPTLRRSHRPFSLSPLCAAFIAALALYCTSAPAAPKSPFIPDTIDFNRDIRPILSENCYACHGPDKNKRKADLRLDTHDGLFRKSEETTVVVPGKSADSELYRRVSTTDEDDLMPPPKANKKLTAEQVVIFKKWIDQGAQWKDHWAYLKPEKPSVPTGQNAVDYFIGTRLASEGLHPGREADRVTLVRRLTFDLTGLPPTPEEVDAFVHDTSPTAYEALVDRLLASPHFGERMAVYWLDLVRFADTVGYHSDVPRDIDAYRDYVINAFNSNKPFDQFTTEQLAGDLLPNPTIEQKIASAYNRLLQTTEEGGAQPKEYAAKYMADRVRNFSAVWLAGTMGCSECHDHKYDPYTQKDFYSLQAFFADVNEAPVGKRQPELLLPTPEQTAKLKEIDDKVAGLKKQLETDTPQLASAQAEWEKAVATRKLTNWTPLIPYATDAKEHSSIGVAKDGTLQTGGPNPPTDTYILHIKTKLKGITAFRLEALPDKRQPRDGPGRSPTGNFVLNEFSVQIEPATPDAKPAPVLLQHASASYEAPNAKNPKAHTSLAASVAISTKPHSNKTGWSIGDKSGIENEAVFETASDLGDGSEVNLTITLRQEAGGYQTLGRFRISATADPRPVRATKERQPPKNILAIIKTDPAQRTADQQKQLAAFYRSVSPVLEPVREQILMTEQDRTAFVQTIRKCLISVHIPPRDIRILARGNWMDDSGQIVQPAVPHFLPQIATNGGARPTRLDLAHWLTSPENPLTARVYTNRLWKLFFGTGISKSLEDLGSQGELPTHPELLDWLACEFRDSGWDVKHVVRLLVTSNTYWLTSVPTREQLERDPENRLYARQSRFRMDAEMVRDNALAAAGLLNTEIGGDSVKPYQPADYWIFLNFPKRTYTADSGPAQYRRGLYVWWQRTFLHPSLLAFDAPTREECTAERPRSNVPQQALVLLNDPTYVEAARVFAERILRHAGSSDADRLAYAYHLALGRGPKPAESAILTGLLQKHLAQFASNPKAAESLIATGQAPVPKDLPAPALAAWTSITRAIFNYSEFITRP